MMTQYGLRKYVEELPRGNPKLVKDFYNNFNEEVDNQESVKHHNTKVLGKWIPFSKKVIDEYLGLTTSEAIYYADFAPDFNDEDVVHFVLGRLAVGELGPFHNGDLGEMAWYMHHFVANNVEPTSSTTTISIQRAHLLFKIWNHKIYLAWYIYEQIRDHGLEKSPCKRVIFPCLITTICKQMGIRSTPREETLLHTDLISRVSFHKARKQIAKKGKQEESALPSGPRESGGSAPVPSYTPFEQQVLDMFQPLNTKVDRLQGSVDQLLANRGGPSDPHDPAKFMDDSAYPLGSF